jgi:hypothetical protein
MYTSPINQITELLSEFGLNPQEYFTYRNTNVFDINQISVDPDSQRQTLKSA